MASLDAPSSASRVAAIALGGGVLGSAGLLIGYSTTPERALFSYLTAYAYTVSISVGALFVLLIGYACNARWMSVIRRVSEVVALGVIPLGLLFAPIALGARRLYLWANPPPNLPSHVRDLLEHKHAYLNVASFVVRAVAYFAIWIASASLLRLWSQRHTHAQAGDPEAALRRERAFSSAMLVPCSLALTFAAFDWLMSLDPLWLSSIFGIYYFAGGFVAGIAAITLLAYLGLRPGDTLTLTHHHFHALGRLLFAFTIFWAYAAYFQVFLISMTDRPNEVTFFVERSRGSWMAVVYLLGLGHFAVPFLFLLPAQVKHRPRYVTGLALWILLMHFVDIHWVVMPAYSPLGLQLHWLDLAALLATSGLTIAFCAFFLRGRSLRADGDPFLPEGVRYASPQ